MDIKDLSLADLIALQNNLREQIKISYELNYKTFADVEQSTMLEKRLDQVMEMILEKSNNIVFQDGTVGFKIN